MPGAVWSQTHRPFLQEDPVRRLGQLATVRRWRQWVGFDLVDDGGGQVGAGDGAGLAFGAPARRPFGYRPESRAAGLLSSRSTMLSAPGR